MKTHPQRMQHPSVLFRHWTFQHSSQTCNDCNTSQFRAIVNYRTLFIRVTSSCILSRPDTCKTCTWLCMKSPLNVHSLTSKKFSHHLHRSNDCLLAAVSYRVNLEPSMAILSSAPRSKTSPSNLKLNLRLQFHAVQREILYSYTLWHFPVSQMAQPLGA